MPYLLIVCFSVWFVDFLRLPQRLAVWLCDKGLYYKTYYGQPIPRRLKPFDCVMCLSFWLALTYSVYEKNFLLAPLVSATTSLGACVLGNLIRKLNAHD